MDHVGHPAVRPPLLFTIPPLPAPPPPPVSPAVPSWSRTPLATDDNTGAVLGGSITLRERFLRPAECAVWAQITSGQPILDLLLQGTNGGGGSSESDGSVFRQVGLFWINKVDEEMKKQFYGLDEAWGDGLSAWTAPQRATLVKRPYSSLCETGRSVRPATSIPLVDYAVLLSFMQANPDRAGDEAELVQLTNGWMSTALEENESKHDGDAVVVPSSSSSLLFSLL
ncbi:hypothetical protein SPI_09373 [Niveomyces insectorum RCEF 264]|uniref:Uncharacterized protein n=1 Tax=Niveomyces insectorum RCEF 264 TaxID=1081102 RepID=A0A162I7Q3_9HYPO|nr:hypothetical protein SPI_09373 [Niveomyces insectorum RCEF 264]